MTKEKRRKLGIEVINDAPWGTHFCLFYRTRKDLIDILVPYFQAGLESNEFCMWVTSEPLVVDDAKRSLKRAVKNLDDYIERGQIEILGYNQWYTKSGKFEPEKVMKGGIQKEKQALKRGFDGLRLTGNTSWLEKKDMKKFIDYEATVDDLIGQYKIIALCAYSLDKCNEFEIIDVLSNHQSALIKREGKWEIIKTSKREQVEDRLRESEEEFASLVQSIPECVYSALPSGELLYMSPPVNRIFGYSEEEFKKDKNLWIRLIHKDDKKGLLVKLEKLLKRGDPYIHEFRMKRKDGNIVWIRDHAKAILDEKGNPTKITGLIFDITERKQAEEELISERERLHITMRSISDGVISCDAKGKIMVLNEMAEKLTGWSQKQAAGKPLGKVFNIISEKTRENCENPIKKVMEYGTTKSLKGCLLTDRSGRERIIDGSCSPMRDKRGGIIGAVIVFRDITERQKIDEELLRSEKLKSVGVLAGGIAHDFRNLLTAILGNISLSEMDMEKTHSAYELLQEAKQASLRARDLTQQLLTFSTGGVPIRKTISLHEIIKDSAGFAMRKSAPLQEIIKDSAGFALSGSNVRCEFSLPEDLWPVEVDEEQFSQVISNLVINAHQAMPEGGIIRVKGENITTKAAGALPIKPGRYVRISIHDQGTGIPRKHLPMIYDPFFTTKQDGSGLGLTTAYSIINRHDGYLTVQSEPGTGTTFYIYLSASQKETLPKKGAKENYFKGEGRILVMDDEKDIRNVTKRMLNRIGYEVEVVEDGAEAIELYRKAKEANLPFDAVILDLTVPGGMGGEDTIKRLKEIDPEVKAIVASGYSDAPLISDYKEYGFQGVAFKPYEIKELGKVLHKVMTGE